MRSKNHVHKYQRVKQKPSGRTIWKCGLPDCSHYTTPELAVGKKSICWGCEEEFVLTKALMSQKVKPKCNKCRRKSTRTFPGKEKKASNITDIIETRIEDVVGKLLG